jgi:hypothetical protein
MDFPQQRDRLPRKRHAIKLGAAGP